jgi:hypothetical protein
MALAEKQQARPVHRDLTILLCGLVRFENGTLSFTPGFNRVVWST